MATAFEGEAVVGITAINFSAASGTAYTVPAGRYAKVSLQKVLVGGTSAAISVGGSVTYTVNLTSAGNGDLDFGNGDGSSNGNLPADFLLLSGQTISATTSGGAVDIKGVALEFANP